MTFRSFAAILCFSPVFIMSGQPLATASAQSRVGLALVIGNSKYADGDLPTVRVDKETMAAALESLGFKVHEVSDLQHPRDFEEEIKTFLKSENAAPEDVLVVYYSGHGLQIDGKAHLMGTAITGSGDMSNSLRSFAISVDYIIELMEEAAPSARVLIVDACRNNAFGVAPRKSGVRFQTGVEDTYVLFADEPGKTVPARTQASLQSPFTAGLLFAFENSEEGIEKRFAIAREKTRQLNPEQNPQILQSPASGNRRRPFLDYGKRSAPTRSAEQLLEEAEAFYNSRSWEAFQQKINAATILSTEPALTARLVRESEFVKLVLSGQSAEQSPTGPKWAEAAAFWQKAGQVFPGRAWTLEKSYLCWLLADRSREAVQVLARLRSYPGSPVVDRAKQVLDGLFVSDPALEAIAKSAVPEPLPTAGPDFERFSTQQ